MYLKLYLFYLHNHQIKYLKRLIISIKIILLASELIDPIEEEEEEEIEDDNGPVFFKFLSLLSHF